jgi:hypothetical protein
LPEDDDSGGEGRPHEKNKSRTFRLTPSRRIGWIIPGRRFQKRRTQIMPAEDRIAARLLEALAGLDLTSADGRAGIHTLLSEIERACPGVLLQQAARMELRAVGWALGRVGSGALGRKPRSRCQ